MWQAILAQLARAIGVAIVQYVIKKLLEGDPEVTEAVEKVTGSVASKVTESIDGLVDRATDVIPGQWDDELLDGLAGKIAEKLPIGDALKVISQLQQILKNLPFGLGGR